MSDAENEIKVLIHINWVVILLLGLMLVFVNKCSDEEFSERDRNFIKTMEVK